MNRKRLGRDGAERLGQIDEFMMLEQGHADVTRAGVQINTLGPGDCFGELAVLADGRPRSASVVATSDLRGIVLTAHFMRELRQRIPSVGERIDRVAAERIANDALLSG
jgi:CRP/FNR family transcriptional regulator, cyclic AMP receptor protein